MEKQLEKETEDEMVLGLLRAIYLGNRRIWVTLDHKLGAYNSN